ncbi:hypothetical protein M885DRAFT_528921 [Pelagophyceae sp. CCMP2097]|nr:hypothetical protein M885DRAFT_528921 [Pelagophyceae sp. CCMP2097]|mmetsp:Transcript_198/g.738  ORF Transcript_198/g.738 Transcript_198/m.738 type:complete len:264 (+) Transcript_198:102-893(+)
MAWRDLPEALQKELVPNFLAPSEICAFAVVSRGVCALCESGVVWERVLARALANVLRADARSAAFGKHANASYVHERSSAYRKCKAERKALIAAMNADSPRHAFKALVSQKSAAERRTRGTLLLLAHSACCEDAHCSENPKCRVFRGLLAHGASCAQRLRGNCANCVRLWSLLRTHAERCRVLGCGVPACEQLKEQARLHSLAPALRYVLANRRRRDAARRVLAKLAAPKRCDERRAPRPSTAGPARTPRESSGPGCIERSAA